MGAELQRSEGGRAEAEFLSRLDKRFRGPLMSFFLRRNADRAEAEDLTQEVFVRLIAAMKRENVRTADALVFTIASNLLRDRARRVATQGKMHIAKFDDHLVSELTREFIEEHSPERVVLAQVQISAVLTALAELGERTKDIYVLFRIERMKQRQIAALYGIGVSTVEREVARATLHLALRFAPEEV